MAWTRSIHIDAVSYKILPAKPITCSQVGPTSLESPMISSLYPNDGHMEDAILLFHIYVGGAMLFNHLKYSESSGIGTRVSVFLTAAFDALLGIREGLLDSRLLHNLPGKRNTTTSNDSPRITTSSAYKKFMGMTNFSRLFRYFLQDSGYMARFFRKM